MIDDRISCHDCADIGRCNGPCRGDPDLLRRCECFRPLRGTADQRTGAQRFPTLVAEAAESTKARAQTGIRQAKNAIRSGA